jgi:hypothetical protein
LVHHLADEPGNAENRDYKESRRNNTIFMKKIIFILFCYLLGSISLAQAQYNTTSCDAVTGEAIPLDPQPTEGNYDYYGAKVMLNNTSTNPVTVQGYIHHDASAPNTGPQFLLVINPGQLSAQTDLNFFQITRWNNAVVTITSISPCPNDIIVTYAGVSITYEVNNNILKFGSFSDVNTVLDQLDSDYNTNYDNYDSQLDTSLSVGQLDSLDEINGFSPRITFRNFENLFAGYSSKKSQIEGIESAWLYNDLSGTHPADGDLTFDDAQNTIFNTDYSFKIGNDLYNLTSTGMYVNGILQGDGGSVAKTSSSMLDAMFMNKTFQFDYSISGPMTNGNNGFYENTNWGYSGIGALKPMTVCKSNKKSHHDFKYDNETKMFELEVAIHSIVFRTGIHGKVIHFKKNNNGHWRRSRAEMAAGCGGNVYTGNCTYLDQPIERQPGSGFIKREEQKAKRHNAFTSPGNNTIWKTYSGEFSASFDSRIGNAVWPLTF